MFRRRWIREKRAYRLLVHTLHGDSIDGILTIEAADGLVLEDATLHPAENGRASSLAGPVFIPRETVRLIQTAPPKPLAESLTTVSP